MTSANTYNNQFDQTRRVFQPNPFTRDYGIKGAEGLNNFNKNLSLFLFTERGLLDLFMNALINKIIKFTQSKYSSFHLDYFKE